MKKTLIALAAVAAVTAVSAQTVTLYGRLDASIANHVTKDNGVKQYGNDTNQGPRSLTRQGIDSSNMNTQFWGMRGSEDLGGGLKAEFKLESQFEIDTGVSRTNTFDREAWVGLTGGFGSIKLGRNYTAIDNFAGAMNHTFNSNINVTTAVADVGLKQYVNRIDNSINYTTPTINGFSAAISHGFGENKTADLSATDNTSLNIRYAAGALQVGFATQTVESRTGSANNEDIKHNLIGGSYNFGVASVTGTYMNSKQGSTKDKTTQIGVAVPMGALTLSAGFANGESKTGATKLKSDGYALLASYDLSKRTAVYAGYESTKVDTSATVERKTTNLAVGVRHTF